MYNGESPVQACCSYTAKIHPWWVLVYIKIHKKGGEYPMYIKNKLSALLLAVALSVSAVAPSFAANSPTGGGGNSPTYVTTPETDAPTTTPATPATPSEPTQTEAPETNVSTNSNANTSIEGEVVDTGVKITKVESTTKNALIPAYVTSADGEVYSVDEIASGAIQDKYDKVSLVLTSETKIRANIASTDSAKETKKFVIKAQKGQKLKATQFSKKAFKNCTGKIVVYSSAMTKKEFKKLVKRLAKGGFKGKLQYKE